MPVRWPPLARLVPLPREISPFRSNTYRLCRGPKRGTARETWETLSLTPNPALSAEHQAAVQEDFGLKSGKLTLNVRQAMLPYTLDHLRLPNGRWEGKPFLVVDGK